MPRSGALRERSDATNGDANADGTGRVHYDHANANRDADPKGHSGCYRAAHRYEYGDESTYVYSNSNARRTCR